MQEKSPAPRRSGKAKLVRAALVEAATFILQQGGTPSVTEAVDRVLVASFRLWPVSVCRSAGAQLQPAVTLQKRGHLGHAQALAQRCHDKGPLSPRGACVRH